MILNYESLWFLCWGKYYTIKNYANHTSRYDNLSFSEFQTMKCTPILGFGDMGGGARGTCRTSGDWGALNST
jgi:hypothetical protein